MTAFHLVPLLGQPSAAWQRVFNQHCEKDALNARPPVSKLLGKDPAEVEGGGALNLDALVSAVLVAHLQHTSYSDQVRLTNYES